MADNTQESSTPNYTHGYGEGFIQRLNRRTAGVEAAYLLPHLKPGMRLLDVGCGPGSISVGLAAAVAPGEFYGIDMAESQIDTATTAAEEAGLTNARFQVADALNLPFPDNHFDAVHCSGLLSHIPDTMAALDEIKRVLKSGGILGAREIIDHSCFIEPDIGNLNRVFPMLAGLRTANGGHPQIGKELPARFTEAGLVDIWCDALFRTWSSSSGIPDFVSSALTNPTMAESAIALGIVTPEDLDQWREAIKVWEEHLGAFAAQAWGQAIGRKP